MPNGKKPHILTVILQKHHMLENVIKELIPILKIGQIPLFGLFFGSSLLLFGPDSLLELIGLTEFLRANHSIIGGIWLGSFCLLLGHLSSKLESMVVPYLKEKRRIKLLKRRVTNLSNSEKEALRSFFENNSKTQPFDMSHGVIGGLEALGVVFRSSNISVGEMFFAYTLQPWAWTHFGENPELIDWNGKVKSKSRTSRDIVGNY